MSKSTSSLFAPLRAEYVNMPLECGTVSANNFLPSEAQKVVHDPDAMFYDSVGDVSSDAQFRASARAEYIILVCRQCRAHTLGLMLSCRLSSPCAKRVPLGSAKFGAEVS